MEPKSILVLSNGKVGVGIRFYGWTIGNWLCINVGLWARKSLLVLWSERLLIYLWCSRSWSFEGSDGEYYKWKLNGNSSWVSIQPCSLDLSTSQTLGYIANHRWPIPYLHDRSDIQASQTRTTGDVESRVDRGSGARWDRNVVYMVWAEEA